jgi:hypothetical protein
MIANKKRKLASDASTYAGMLAGMSARRKVTVHLPEELLAQAQRASGHGITETLRQGLQLVAAGDTFRRVSMLRGRVKFSIDLQQLRKDRP